MKSPATLDYPSDAPVNQSAFWQFLENNQIDIFMDAIYSFLDTTREELAGKVAERQIYISKVIFKHFWYCKTHGIES